MNYVKKMCILRQVKQGFSGDGKALSGLIKIEQYGKNLAIEVSVINFAPLVSGEYYCLLSDGNGKTEMLSLRGKSLFNILSDLDISRGFCGVICYVKNEIVPIAYGINGNGSYDWRKILNSALPPVFPKRPKAAAETEIADTQTEETAVEEERTYDDETVATENYYREEQENGQELFQENSDDAQAESAVEDQTEKTGADLAQNVDADGARHPFEVDGDGYYRAVKTEIDELFAKYPRDDTLNGAFSCSEWVRVKGENDAPEYLVGVVYDDGAAKYICYALAAEDKENPPEEIRAVCTFVPVSPFEGGKGYFVIFQSATTGECIKPSKI
ncbi:MAG: hypothetical protein IJX96_04915 [Clostridia bacterium]|nr:hypothetical protein [Clostridia bacterium]